MATPTLPNLLSVPPGWPDCARCESGGTVQPGRDPSFETVCPDCGGLGAVPPPDSQPREHAVLCWRCLKNRTWRPDGLCEPCKQKEM